MTLKLRAMLMLGIVLFGGSFSLQAQYAHAGQFQLAPPSIEVTHTFFETSTTVSLDLDIEGVELRYSLDGVEVTESSSLYEGPITLNNTATIKAKAFRDNYKVSDEVSVQVIRINRGKPIGITYTPDPAPQYAGQGAKSLSDFRKGSMNFRDGQWLGFSSDTITFKLNSETSIEQLNLSVLADHGSWIFAPSAIEVWKEGHQIGNYQVSEPTSFASKSFQFIKVPLQDPAQGALQVKVFMNKIPDWHDGKGTTPWLFIDEIFISN